jgi:hypothetical protein
MVEYIVLFTDKLVIKVGSVCSPNITVAVKKLLKLVLSGSATTCPFIPA